MRHFQPIARLMLAMSALAAPATALADINGFNTVRFSLDLAAADTGTGNLMIVGCQEQAVVYSQSAVGLDWISPQTLVPSPASANQLFGYSVAIRRLPDGSTLAAVGAPGEGVEVPSGLWLKKGAVYVYRRPSGGSSWTQEARLTAGGTGDFFGESVAISPNGDQIAVGASYDLGSSCGGAVPSGFSGGLCAGEPHPDGVGNGNVYLFRKISTGWTAGDALVDNAGNPSIECFGRSIAYGNPLGEPNELLVGAPNDIDLPGSSGTVYVLRQGSLVTSTYVLQQTIVSANPGFGHDLSVDEASGRAVIGAPFGAQGAVQNVGRASTYRRTAGVWGFEADLVPPRSVAGTANACFGASVSTVAGRVLVGTGRRSNALSLDPNQLVGGMERAYLYRVQDGDSTWSLLSELRHELTRSPVVGDKFGASVCLLPYNTPSGYYAVAGLPLRDGTAADRGAFSMFDAGNNKAGSPFLSNGGGQGWECGVRGGRAFATAPFDVVDGVNFIGSATILGFDGTRWFTEAALTPGALLPAGNHLFGRSGCILDDNTVLFGASAAPNASSVATGRVFRATKNTTTGAWSLQACGVPRDIVAGADYGMDIGGVKDNSGEYIVAIGAPLNNHSGRTAAGTVAIYRNSGLLGSTPLQIINATSPQNNDYFGSAVAMERMADGTIDLWVSCPGRDGATGTDSGSLFLYRRSPTGTLFTLVLADTRIQGAKPGDFIGGGSQQLDFRGNLLVVGGSRDFSGTALNSGVVGILQRQTNGAYLVRNSIAPSLAETSFGQSVATNGTQFLVGAPRASFSAAFPDREGRHDLYKIASTGAATLISSTFQPDRRADDGYGWSVALSTGTTPVTFVGAILDDNGRTPDGGSVYGFAGATNPCATDSDADGINGATDLAAILSAWGTVGGTAALDPNNDGIVDAQDIAALLSNWGGCE